MIKEFKEFAVRGNAIDLAIGVILGASFGKIVTSIVEDLIMPPVGKLVGNLDFSNLYLPLSDKVPHGIALADAKKLGPVLAYGNFITIVLNFLIVAFCIFMLVKALNAIKQQQPRVEKPGLTKECPSCCMEIPAKASRCRYCTSELK